MEKIQFLDHFESWKLLVSVLVALLGAFLFYFKDRAYNPITKYLLGSLRFFSILILMILVWAPKVKTTLNQYKTPKVILLVDNSTSLLNYKEDLKISLKKAKKHYQELEYDVQIISFNGTEDNIDSIQYDHPSSEYQSLFEQINEQYLQEDIYLVELFTDGIETGKHSFLTKRIKHKVNTIGLGDTTTYYDLSIPKVSKNNTVLKNNSFLVNVTLQASPNLIGKKIKVKLLTNNQTKKDTILKIRKAKTSIFLKDTPKKPGLRAYKVTSEVLGTNERNTKNNSKKFYIDVIDKEQNILIIYQAPHPDIKYFKSILRDKEGINLKTLSVKQSAKTKLKDFELIITHNVNVNSTLIAKIKNSKIPTLSIMGNTNAIEFYNLLNQKTIVQPDGSTNYVNISLNKDFKAFRVDPDFEQSIHLEKEQIKTPTVLNYNNAEHLTILHQNLGSIKLDAPLLAVQLNKSPKTGFILTDDLWRLKQNLSNSDHDLKRFNGLWIKTFDLLALEEQKSRLKVQLDKQEYTTSQSVNFFCQALNKAYENIEQQKISILVKSDKGFKESFSFKTSKINSKLSLSRLPQGNYSYTASTNIDGEKFTLTGKFAIISVDLEQYSSKADFEILKDISIQQGGYFRTVNQPIEESQLAKKVIHSTFEEKQLKDNHWLILLLICLITAEWSLRKYFGSL